MPPSEPKFTSRRLPPGPFGLPFIGCVFSWPTTKPWITFTEWKDTYGDLVYGTVLGNKILVINSLEDARELLVNRSSNNSERPNLHVACDLVGCTSATRLTA
jgi:hypothetical protein